MDSGEEIPGLNEDWTFLGAKLFEWMAGFMALVLASEFLVDHPGRSMPFLVLIMIGTTVGLKTIRSSFPDEERGMRNKFMTFLGFEPPDIPAPSALQPMWSATPLKELDQECNFKQFHLDAMFDEIADMDDPENEGLYGSEIRTNNL